MAVVTLAFPDYILSGADIALSGGAWESDLPLDNLLRSEFAYKARSINAALTSTRLWIDHGEDREVRAACVPRCNGSSSCRVRLRGFTTQDETGTAIADTGWRGLYGEVRPFDTLYWGHASLWDGRYGRDEVALFNMPFVATFPTAPVARYWLLEFDDTGNEDGYIELPRVVMAPGWQPSLNMSYGATVAVEDGSQLQTTPGGADFFEARAKRRVARFSLQQLPTDEMMTWAFDAQMRLGLSGQLMFVWDADDAPNLHRWSFLGRMRQLSPLEANSFGRSGTSFEIVEIVA